jgi:pyruvate dehydrogenase E2 component (dihydrolipoamide acetyltransferase)
MTEGTILTWLVDDGAEVAVGDELVEIETDKAAMTYAAEEAGVLRVVAAVGDTVPVGGLIALVGEAVATEPSATEPTPGPAVAAVGASPPPRDAAERVATSSPASGTVAPDGADRVEPTRLQRLVARRMAETSATVPEFEVQTEVAMDAAIALRAQLKALGGEERPVPTFNDMILRACAIALRRHPRVNATYREGGFYEHRRVGVGFAVASGDALVVPVVADADRLPLGAIAAETRRLAAAVRDGTVSPRELEGGTFTVSNLGMLGMTAIRPIIHAGQAAILGVGAMRPTLARVDGEVVDRTLMTLTLSADHRILYGAAASRFLADVRDLLERSIAVTL